MSEIVPLAWSVPVCTVAYFTHRVAIRWLDAREKKNIRDEHRDERDTAVVAVLTKQVEDMGKRLDDMAREQKNFTAANRR